MSREPARELLPDFAVRTGVAGAAPPRRHLWTDAFARSVDRRELLARVHASLRAAAAGPGLGLPADHRLAFRELGLSIGLRAVDAVASPLAPRIEAFWSDPAHRRGPTWREHRDIDDVMLAASLAASLAAAS